ncbi:MAG TPA: hypothetical protein DCR14_04595, partial [Acidimicrobiaceae bacterium]|nr:hypothetical protein [Acidimicrobiaceae bacterium]
MSGADGTVLAAIGGTPAVEAVVERFYQRLVADPAVQHHFHPDRLESLKAGQVRWFTAVLSGHEPPADLAHAHAHLEITDEQVAAVVGHLDEVLAEVGVGRRVRRGIDGGVG